MNKKKAFITIILFLFCQFFYAQVEKEGQPLVQIIQKLEQQFQCSFSYADKSIENVFINLPSNLHTLQKTVEFLQENTSLKFTLLSNNFITISNKSDTIFICGYLKDLETNEWIQDATIQSKNKSTITNEHGYFELKNISVYDSIYVKHLSYESTKYFVNQFIESKCNILYLVGNTEQINEIVIRNYLTKGIGKTIEGSYHINYKNFGILPGLIEPDVLQTIQALPGILSVDETVSNINIRGGSHNENLILYDGIKMYQSGHFFGLISAFNPYLTKNVVLIKNGTSASFSDGVSGTILMHTDDELTRKLKAEIGLNLINADVFLDIPLGEKSSIQVAARKSISEWIQTPTYKQYFDKAFQNTEVVKNFGKSNNSDEEFTFYDVNVRLLYHVTEKDKIRVNLLTFSNDINFLENVTIRDEEVSRESSASQNNLAASAFYNREWNDKFSTDVQLYITKYGLESINFDILNKQRLIQENSVLEGSIKIDTKYILTDHLTFYNGFQFIETGITNIQDVNNPVFRSEIKEVLRSQALFSQIAFQSKNAYTNLKVGLRMNYLGKFDSFLLEPRLSFSQRFLNHFTVEVLGEFKHQTTTQVIEFQNDFLGVENRRWLLVNDDDIPIIKSKQASVGLHYNTRGWLIGAEGYYKFVDGITTQSQGFQNQYQFAKTDGSYTVYGADFLINKRYKNLSAWLSYSYADNTYTFKELEDVEFPNNLDIRHAISLASSYTLKNFKISSGLNWHSGKPTTKPIFNDAIEDERINYEPANSSRLNDYMRIDISAQYSFKMGEKVKAHAGVSVWNLLNTENVINNYYRRSNSGVNEIEQYSLALTPNVSFRVTF